MEEVVAVRREVGKARSDVDELPALNGIIADPNVSEEVRANAKLNWAMKCSEVYKQVAENNDVLQSERYSDSVKPGVTPRLRRH